MAALCMQLEICINTVFELHYLNWFTRRCLAGTFYNFLNNYQEPLKVVNRYISEQSVTGMVFDWSVEQ